MRNDKTAIIYIITQLELGGAQKICLSLFDQLNDEKHVTYLISSNQGILTDKVKNNSRVFLSNYLKRTVSISNALSEVKAFFSLVRQLRKIRKQYPICIVHTHSTKAGILGRWAAWAAGIKKRVHTIHGFAFHNNQSWLSWLPIYLVELITSFITTHFICVSRYDQHVGNSWFPFFRKKNSLIRAAISLESFTLSSAIEKKIVGMNSVYTIGTISCFKPQKNLFDLLYAFNKVHKKHSHVRLEIIGDGQLRPPIEAWIQKNNFSRNITLHGWQSNVIPFLQQWHLFGLSSLWEGLPCAVVEARSMQLPVVSYDTGGISDFIKHGVNGYLVAQHNWQELATYIEKFIENEKLYITIASHTDLFDDFSINTMLCKHKELYSHITG